VTKESNEKKEDANKKDDPKTGQNITAAKPVEIINAIDPKIERKNRSECL
jgi:hypothetical protein